MNTEKFLRDLSGLLNTHSIDTDLNTPDFILSSYLAGCLGAYKKARERTDDYDGWVKKGIIEPSSAKEK